MVLKRRPFFSIVIPTYNRATDLRFALFCILRQNFSDYEIVVSDNCSTDNTKDIVKELANKHIRYFKNKSNVGMIGNQALAIKRARGNYIFLHADDDFLLYTTSLKEIYDDICVLQPGYVRLNYASLSSDKKHTFLYKVNKPFQKNYYLDSYAENEKVLSFIIDSDNYFFTGILFRNDLPKHIAMIDADPSPWIDILFYITKRFGGCFIAKRHLLAYWSRRTIKTEDHGFYMLQNGKLKAEKYFEAVKKKVDRETYVRFLHKELVTIYVNLFPAIKEKLGNTALGHITTRVCLLDHSMRTSVPYLVNSMLAYMLPRGILKYIRDIYLFMYMRISKIPEEKEIMERFQKLQREYLTVL